MNWKNRSRLSFEQLEDRTVPSVSVRFFGGNLFLRGDNQTNILSITNVGSTNLRIMNNGANLGTFNVTGRLDVQMGNNNDRVGLDLNGNSLPGYLFIRTGFGNDNVFIDDGNINGLVTFIDTGNGNDNVFIGNDAAVNIAGLSLSVHGGLGDDTLIVLNSSQILGILVATNVNNINLGTDLVGSQYANIVASFPSESRSNSFILGAGSVVSGNVTFIGANSVDNVILDADIFGNATVLGKEGTNTLQLSVLGSNSIGNLTYLGGGGMDNVEFSVIGTTTIPGNVNLNMGNGDNTYNFANPFSVFGSMVIFAGGGTDNIGDFNGTVDGSLTINAGAGGNTLNLLDTSVIGGNFFWTSGAGVDDVTISGTIFGNAILNFGPGADILTLTATASIGGFLFIDFGMDFDLDTFIQDPAATFGDFSLKNLP